jgi:integrase
MQTLEQGQADRTQTPAVAEAGLGHSTRLQLAGRTRDLALFNLAIDSKLRGCDVVSLKVEDVAPHGYALDRAIVRQNKTGLPVRFEITGQTRQAIDEHLAVTRKRRGIFCSMAAAAKPSASALANTLGCCRSGSPALVSIRL